MLRYAFVLAVALWAGVAAAADQPQYGPPGDWVKPLPIPVTPASADDSAAQILLDDVQAKLGGGTNAYYVEFAIKILTPQGLEAFANISQSWRPDTETLIIHRLDIIRDGKTIDLLGGGKNVAVLRRETNLDMAMLDGALTATVQPEGLRVGDIVDEAITVERRDPVLQGHSEEVTADRHPGLAGRVYMRTVWPAGTPMRWRTTEGLVTPSVSQTGQTKELVTDEANVLAPKPPRDAPSRFTDVGELEVSDFKSWSDVSALMAPYYLKAASLAPDSPLRQEADKIRRASADPKTQVEAALRLVEDQVHYVALNMNFGGFIPADADITWSRRFGDCKGKSALLLALLHELGVEAEPVLVNTAIGDGLNQRLPMLSVFDHVIVRATVGGKSYWLDGTRIGDRGLNDIPPPSFHWVLPLRTNGAEMEKEEAPPFTEPAFESLERLDASAGYDIPAPAHAEQVFRGDAALSWRLALENLGRADAERAVREYWRSQISWIDAKSVDFAYDEDRHVMRLSMDGAATMDWTKNADRREFQIVDSNLGFTTSFKREPGPHADAPFSVEYPSFNKWTVVITLPDKGAGFALVGAPDVDQTLVERHYIRHSSIANGVVTMVAEEQSLAPELPYAQAQADSAALRTLNTWDVTVQGPGEPEAAQNYNIDLTTTPTDAAGFSRRGVAFVERRDYSHAIADFSAAAALEPKVAKHVYNRGAARFMAGQTEQALADFNLALQLNPHDELALIARGKVYLAKADMARAKADFDEAVKANPADGETAARIAGAYDDAGQYEAAVRAYDTAVALATEPNARAMMLNARCWAKAEWGRELDTGLADCNAALALMPGVAGILDSRGFARLRLGLYKDAIADYEAALAVSPRLATSLFGRGVAELRLGQSTAGATDIDAAKAQSSGIEAQFARYGVKP